jgi:hypothetical protein
LKIPFFSGAGPITHSSVTPSPTVHPSAPARSIRFGLAIAVALAAGLYVWGYARANPDFVSDFDQLWAAARALLAHDDPYRVVGPRGAFLWKWPLYYPLPAVIIVAPLGLVPVVVARIVFSAVSAGLFTLAITRDGFGRLPVLLSISFVTAIELVQWSPLLAAGALLPWLSWIAVAKPNLGVAMAAHASSWRPLTIMLVGSALLVGASLVLLPTWPVEWWHNVRSAPHFVAPVMRPAGFLLLTVLARWRRPEARLLAALACVPKTPTFYDHVLVFLVARTTKESLLLVVLTFVVYFAVAFAAPFSTFQQWGDFVANATLVLVYAPAVIMVLRRPNEGTLPRGLDRFVERIRPTRRAA